MATKTQLLQQKQELLEQVSALDKLIHASSKTEEQQIKKLLAPYKKEIEKLARQKIRFAIVAGIEIEFFLGIEINEENSFNFHCGYPRFVNTKKTNKRSKELCNLLNDEMNDSACIYINNLGKDIDNLPSVIQHEQKLKNVMNKIFANPIAEELRLNILKEIEVFWENVLYSIQYN